MSKEPENLFDDDNSDSCAVCGKKQFSAANLSRQVFQVNTANNCGHKFCSSCIDRELSRKRQFSCPQCTSMVSREKLSNRSIDETEVERDFRIRKGIKAIFNKTEVDFPTLDSFKDYEEMVEDLIFNKVNSLDVEDTNAAIERYKQTNSDIITINQMRRNEDIKKEFSTIKEDEDLKRLHDAQFHESLKLEMDNKKQQKRQMNQIMLSDFPVSSDFFSSDSESRLNPNPPPAAAAAAPSVPFIPNPVQLFLLQRPEPRKLVERSKLEKREMAARARSSSFRRKVDRVGGYDFAIFERRNWIEISAQVRSEQ
eukprot:gene32092-42830_t